MRPLFLVAIATGACYHTTHEVACQASCTAENPACPGSMACGLDFMCHGEGEADCGDASVFVIPDVPLCLGTGIPDFAPDCPTVIPSDSIELAGSFDTDDDARCNAIEHQLDASTACLVHAGRIHVTAGFAPTGTRPLALIAFADLVVDGAIDVAAHTGSGARPAGGDDPRCAVSIGNDDFSGAGGGAGGSFGSSGGAGGGGDGTTLSAPVTATDAGRALRGGCPGSRGGNTSAAPNNGHGGGAIYLVARDAIAVNAAIDASGSGALASLLHGGGGGGGSGGMIVLEAPAIHLAATVFADGGGASGGGAAVPGGAGADPTVATAGMGAAGGGTAASTTGQDASGPGGRGSSLTMKSGQRGIDALGVNHGAGCGGGGGGGGGGHVFILTANPTIDPGVVVSPVET